MFDMVHLIIYSPDKSKAAEIDVNTILTVRQVIEELVWSGFLTISNINNCVLLVENQGRLFRSQDTFYGIADQEVLRIVFFSDCSGTKSREQEYINVSFQNSDAHIIEVELDPLMTAEQAIQELIRNAFVPDSDTEGYSLFIGNSPDAILNSQTLQSSGAVSGSVIRVEAKPQ